MGQYQPPAETAEIAESLMRAAAALREADVDFALAGSVACWARGGPSPCNDLDLGIRPADVDRAADALARAEMKIERPPEGWLLKAWDGDVLVDLIWDFEGDASADDLLDRAEQMAVHSVYMPVLRIDDVIVSKLLAFDEHALDFAGPLAICRALREQVDWHAVRERTAGSPYARAFLALLRELQIVEPLPPSRATEPRVRVVPGG
jgi:Uncharacterised nucleotidyltransferase